MTIHADLDLSLIDEMPPGRQPVKTSVIEPHQRETVYAMIESEVQAGHQAFIVYPLVEDSETSDLGAAVSNYERLQKVFHKLRVGLLHGKMSADEKDAIMAAFRDHQFDVMVTTSVAEVGVDIPNATLILIEHATRFGLAQLHQFRGRVGRGGHTAYCILICDSHVEAARDRLKVLQTVYDGFELAHIDWKLRGAGDLIGTRQSGGSALLLQASIETPGLIEAASREARTIYAADPYLNDPQHRLLRTRIEQLQNARADVS